MCTAQTFIRGEFILGSDNRLISEWKSFKVPNKAKRLNLGHIETQGSCLVITAVATLEQKCTVQSNDGRESRRNFHSVIDQRSSVILPQSSSNDSEEVEEREKLRRMRISEANKGNTPWNKGRKHSAETLQRIKERTRLAMQNPKVKMKLVNLGHAQSKETRIKIGVSVRVGWERRREKLMIQEGCHFEWQNLIAEASRRGIGGEEDLQWDSYKILDKQFELEWLESVEKRKNKPQPKGGKKGPKSLEQRRKISEAISAKWTDPGYRDRVFSALSKYHGTPVGVPRKAKRKLSEDTTTRKRSPVKNKVVNDKEANEAKSQIQRPRLRRGNVPLYKDPLAGSKLEMIKNIRAQRASAETKRTEAIERAKLLIAEAEKAANGLEVAAKKSPLAQASLIETRKLIAEAIQSIESIGIVQIHAHDNSINSFASTRLTNHVVKEKDAEIEDQSRTDHRKINGSQALESSESNVEDIGFGQFSFQDLFNGKDELLPRSSSDYGSLNGKETFYNTFGDNGISPSELDNMIKDELGQLQPNGIDGEEKTSLPNGAKFNCGKEDLSSNSIVTTKKKWVRGKLVELTEEDSD